MGGMFGGGKGISRDMLKSQQEALKLQGEQMKLLKEQELEQKREKASRTRAQAARRGSAGATTLFEASGYQGVSNKLGGR